jgi:Tfp pilus assembly PilM family ATPase
MPAREIIAGASVDGPSLTFVGLEHRGDEIELLHAAVRQRPDQSDDLWFASALCDHISDARLRVSQVNVSLDADSALLLSFPLDATLTQAERNEHVQWELSHFIENYQPRDFISDLHVLETRSQDQSQYVLSVTVRRDMIFGLQRTLKDRGLTLGIVDVNPFASIAAISRGYPDIKKGTVAVVGIATSRIEATIVHEGRMTKYGYAYSREDPRSNPFLSDFLTGKRAGRVYFYGSARAREYLDIHRRTMRTPGVLVDPFHRLLISPAFPGFDRYMSQAFRFACAVGIALRRA